MARRTRLINLLCLGAALLIGTSFLSPIWCLTAQAVQYETEFPEGLKVYVYLSRIGGDLYELNLMNKWIGAHFPKDVPEMVIFPILFGGLALLCSAAALVNRWKKSALKLALIALLVVVVAGAASLQGRLYTFGHVRDPNPPILIPDFTVPLMGSMKLWNWTIATNIHTGAYTMALAALLLTWAYVMTVRGPTEGGGMS